MCFLYTNAWYLFGITCKKKGERKKKGKRVKWEGSYGVTKRRLIEVFHIILYGDYLNYLVCDINQNYVVLYLFDKNVILYQAKSFMLDNVCTIYRVFYSKD